MPPLPEAPVNVVLELIDGTVLHVDTVYVDWNNGAHTWAILNGPDPTLVRHVHIDKLPPLTAVILNEGFSGT